MRTYCTLFDRHYLTRGVALYRSLERVATPFRLFVFCMDASTAETLRRLEAPSLEVVPLRALEEHDAGLAGTKSDRTQVEYCWTATPAVCRYVLETEAAIDEVTYLDADLQFFSDPEPLFEELDGDAVLIVPHRYAPEYRYKEPTSGTYNVEWLTFRRDEDGLAALHWWHERCLEWCYFRWEDGKLGDQKYLDDFPRLFDRVHVLEHPGGGLAPWNVSAHALEERDGRVEVDGRPLVFYHHHSLQLYRRDAVGRLAVVVRLLREGVDEEALPWRTNYPVEADELRLVWEPYLTALSAAAAELEAAAPGSVPDLPAFPLDQLARRVSGYARRRLGRAYRELDPVRLLPGARRRYRDSWRSEDVARQMIELTDQQLRQPENVPPYRAFRTMLEHLLADHTLPNPARLLDIGAGAGAYGELLERWAPDRFDYTGADYSADILVLAQSRWPDRRFVQRDLFAPGALAGYDVVLASALLDVLVDIDDALEALLGADAPWVLLHRQRIDSRRTHAGVAPGYRGQRTYRSYLSMADLKAAAARHGRQVELEVEVDGDVRSFVLRRR